MFRFLGERESEGKKWREGGLVGVCELVLYVCHRLDLLTNSDG